MTFAEFIYFVVLPSVMAAPTALIVRRRFRHWSPRRIILLSPAPFSGIAVLLAILLITMVTLSTAKACGVDACGMALFGAMLLLALALIIHSVGSVLAWAALKAFSNK
jgi:hypothetical protein